MIETTFKHTTFNNGIISITAPMGEQIYLILGSKQAMLIDTGMGIGSLKEYVLRLTQLPLLIINTHGHPDHAGGNGEFASVYQQINDSTLYKEMCSVDFRRFDIQRVYGRTIPEFENHLIPFSNNTLLLEDGQDFDIGNRRITVIATPGHSHGCICIYDHMTSSLFTGDMVTASDTWLHLVESTSVKTYLDSMLYLTQKITKITQIYPGHIPTPLDAKVISDKISIAKKILLMGQIGEPATTFVGSGLRYEYNSTGIIYNPDRITV